MNSVRKISHGNNIALIILVVLLSHGLLLLNDGRYWDDWIVLNLFEKGGVELRNYFDELGINLASYFFFMVNSVNESLFSYKLATFMVLLATPLIVYSLTVQSGMLSILQSLWIALLFAACPANQSLAASMAIFTYTFSCFIFFIASLLTLRIVVFQSQPGDARTLSSILLRALTLGLFFISFTMMSLIVFYFGFLTYWFLKEKEQNKGKDLFSSKISAFVRRRPDYILLPFIFWILKILFFEPHGNFEGQNTFHFGPLSVLKNLVLFVYYPFIQLVNSVPANVLANPLAYLFFLFLIHRLTNKKPSEKLTLNVIPAKAGIHNSLQPLDSRFRGNDMKGLVLFGLYLLILSILPYVLVGKSPGLYGETITRHAWLTPLPMALLIVATIGFIKTSQKEILQKMLLTAILSSFVITSVENYTMWQKRWIKFQSIAGHLSSFAEGEGSSTYVIEDHYPIGSKYNDTAEWEGLLVRMCGKKEIQFRYKRNFSNQTNLPADGTLISVFQGTDRDEENYVLLKYFYYRLTGNDAKLKSLLGNFVHLSVQDNKQT